MSFKKGQRVYCDAFSLSRLWGTVTNVTLDSVSVEYDDDFLVTYQLDQAKNLLTAAGAEKAE